MTSIPFEVRTAKIRDLAQKCSGLQKGKKGLLEGTEQTENGSQKSIFTYDAARTKIGLNKIEPSRKNVVFRRCIFRGRENENWIPGQI